MKHTSLPGETASKQGIIASLKKKPLRVAWLAVGSLLLAALVLSALPDSPAPEAEGIGDPSDACPGLYYNRDIEHYNDWSPWMNGGSWESAYRIENTAHHRFIITGTDLHLEFINATFNSLTIFGARHIRFINCSFGDTLQFKYSEHISVTDGLLNSTDVLIKGSEDIELRGSRLLASPIRLVSSSGCEVSYNHFEYLAGFDCNAWSSSNYIYGNDLRGLSFTEIYITDGGYQNRFYRNHTGNLFNFGYLRANYPGLCFEDFGVLPAGEAQVLDERGIVLSHPHFMEEGFSLGGRSLPYALFGIPEVWPSFSVEMDGSLSEDMLLFSEHMPEVSVHYNDSFFIGSTRITLGATGEELTREGWERLPSGEQSIIAEATHILGDTRHKELSVLKDVECPEMNITTPQNILVGNDPFEVSLNYEDHSGIDSLHVGFPTSGSNNTEFIKVPHFEVSERSLKFTVPAANYSEVGDGIHTLTVQMRDLVGLQTRKNLTFDKDTADPELNVTVFPEYRGWNGPDRAVYSCNVTDAHYSHLTVEASGISVPVLIEGNGTLPAALWDQLDHGTHTLLFTAYDLGGNRGEQTAEIKVDLAFDELSWELITPIISRDPPQLEATVGDSAFEEASYELLTEEGMGVWGGQIANGSLYLDPSAWDELPDGKYTLKGSATDYFGNARDVPEIEIIKDCTDPNLTITDPTCKEAFFSNEEAPYFSLSLSDSHLSRVYYTIPRFDPDRKFYVPVDGILNQGEAGTDGGTLTGRLNGSVWEEMAGQVTHLTLTFYAVDEAGNIYSDSVMIITSPVHYLESEVVWTGIGGCLVFALAVSIGSTLSKNRKLKKLTDGGI